MRFDHADVVILDDPRPDRPPTKRERWLTRKWIFRFEMIQKRKEQRRLRRYGPDRFCDYCYHNDPQICADNHIEPMEGGDFGPPRFMPPRRCPCDCECHHERV